MRQVGENTHNLREEIRHSRTNTDVMRLFACNTVFFFCACVTMVCCAGEGEGVAIDFSNEMYSRLDSEGKQLLVEYSQVYLRIKSFYNNLRMDVTEKTYRYTLDSALENFLPPDSPPLQTHEREYEVRLASQDKEVFSRVDSHDVFVFVENSGVNNLQMSSVYRQRHNIAIETPKMAYELSKRDSQAKYFSLNIKRDLHKYDPVVLMFDKAAYASSGTPLEYLLLTYPPYLKPFLKNNPYKIDYVKPVMVQDFPLVEIKTSIAGSESYTIIKLMRNTWVVNEVFSMTKVDSKNDFWERSICTYDKNSESEMPLLKNYTELKGRYVQNGDKKTEHLIQKREYEITGLVPGPVPLEEFDVKQFLPPEAGDVDVGIAKATLSTRRIVCLVLGVVLLITGIGLQVWKARRSRNK